MPSPLPRSMLTPPLSATARSSLPSPFRSPVASPIGRCPVVNCIPLSLSVPSPFPKSTPTLLPLEFVTRATSTLPSLLKSPAADESASVPPPSKSRRAMKPPSPSPISTSTAPRVKKYCVPTMSNLLSPFTSTAAIKASPFTEPK